MDSTYEKIFNLIFEFKGEDELSTEIRVANQHPNESDKLGSAEIQGINAAAAGFNSAWGGEGNIEDDVVVGEKLPHLDISNSEFVQGNTLNGMTTYITFDIGLV